MSKHTPGPWVVEGKYIYALMHNGFAKGKETFRNRFSASITRDRDCPEEEAQANARLIAAAPDLLEALEKVQAWMNGGSDDELAYEIDLALTKAKGE